MSSSLGRLAGVALVLGLAGPGLSSQAGAAPRRSILAGPLTAPSTAAPADVGRAYLATGPELIAGLDPAAFRVDQVLATRPGGSIVKMQQTWNGLEVVGAQVSLRLGADGRILWGASSAVDVRADLSATPSVTAEQAIAAVYAGPARHQGARKLDAAKHTRLVVWAPPNQPARLAWAVGLPRDLRFLETLLSYVDASTGQVILTRNMAMKDRQALVFEQNPVATPSVVTVTLDSLTAGATQLDGPDILGRNCVDNGNCIPFDTGMGTFNIHMCDFVPTAIADGAGDFTQYTRPATDLEPEDEFAEVQMYYHSTKIYEYFRGFGLTNVNAHPMQVVANFRIPTLDISAICLGTTTTPGGLNPVDNAVYIPANGITTGFPAEDMLIFGQGTGADLAYEGDVVYHEFGHAVAGTIAQMGVVVADAYGIDPTPGGMSEGFADWFAGTYTNDPSIGEYSGPTFGLGGPIRNMNNTDTCPNSLWGEVHQDALPWTGALWEIRETLAAGDRPMFDQATYNVLGTIVMFDTMLSVRAKIVTEVQALLGATAAATATTVFNARGFDDCNNRVIDTATLPSQQVMQMYGTDQIPGIPMVPAPLQSKLTLAEDSTEITVNVLASQGGFSLGGMGAAPAIKLLVKPADEPILWSGNLTTNDSTASADVVLATTGNMGGSGKVTGSFPAGVYHVQLANAGGSVFLQGISYSNTPGTLEPDAGPPAPDAGAGSDGGTVGGDGDGDCGCRAGGSGRAPIGTAAVLIGLAAFLLVLIRGRRRR